MTLIIKDDFYPSDSPQRQKIHFDKYFLILSNKNLIKFREKKSIVAKMIQYKRVRNKTDIE